MVIFSPGRPLVLISRFKRLILATNDAVEYSYGSRVSDQEFQFLKSMSFLHQRCSDII